jgi:hypothetical protein
MTTIKFSLTLEEANKIFKALGKEPFNEVYELIGKLNEQANEQLAKNSFQITKNTKEVEKEVEAVALPKKATKAQ